LAQVLRNWNTWGEIFILAIFTHNCKIYITHRERIEPTFVNIKQTAYFQYIRLIFSALRQHTKCKQVVTLAFYLGNVAQKVKGDGKSIAPYLYPIYSFDPAKHQK